MILKESLDLRVKNLLVYLKSSTDNSRAIKRKKKAIIAKWNDIVWLGLFKETFPWLYFELAKKLKHEALVF